MINIISFLINKINNLFWKKSFENKELVKVYHKKDKPFYLCEPDFGDEGINLSYQNDNKKWYHNEFIYFLKGKTLIEPSNYIAVKGFRTLVLESFSNSSERPSLIKYLKFRLFFRKTKHIEKAVLFDGSLGRNYFHFFSDVINKIWLLDRFNFPKDIPLIIPKSTYDKTYFQFFINNSELKERKWIVQDNDTWLSVDTLMLLKAMPYHREYWQNTVELVTPVNKTDKKRIFLTRSQKAGRYISNMKDIEPVLKKYGFEIADTGEMSFQEQVDTFAGAEFIIGIHGAGNTNIIFADWSRLKFMEVMPADRIACHYYWLANTLCVNYNVIKGGVLDKQKSFSLCPKLLEKQIVKTLNS